MHHSTLHSLFRYKAWADGELLDALATLDAAQVDAIFKGNLLGEPHGFSATNTPETPTLAALRSAIGKLDAWYLDYVASLSQADGEAVLSFNFVDGDKGQMSRAEMLLHLVTHGGYHRGAIGRLLVQCGITPPRDTLTAFLHRNEPERRGG